MFYEKKRKNNYLIDIIARGVLVDGRLYRFVLIYFGKIQKNASNATATQKSTDFTILVQVVEDFILDSEKQMNLFQNFIEKGGRRTLIVYVQMGDPPTLESGRMAAVSTYIIFYTIFFYQNCIIWY